MKMLLKSFFLLLLLQFGAAFSLPYHEVQCETDRDCPPDSYCYEVSNLCAPCIEEFCKRINRENSYRKCHKEYDECGKCLPGFEEETLTDGTTRGPCIRMQPVHDKITDTSEKMDTFLSGYLMGSIIGVIVLSVVVVSLMYYKVMTRNRRNVQRQPEEDPLTNSRHSICNLPISKSNNTLNVPAVNPYFEPTAPPEEIRSLPVITNNIYVDTTKQSSNTQPHTPQDVQKATAHYVDEIPKFENKFQEAQKFKEPDYVNEPTPDFDEHGLPVSTEVNESLDIIDSAATANQRTQFSYHDEETQPSFWTPNRVEEGEQSQNDEATNESHQTKRLNGELSNEVRETKRFRLSEESEEERED